MYTTEGIILKKQDSGEADAIFTIYTKDFGKIRALAQGVKKENAKLKGHLEPLNLSSVSFVLGKNGERLTQAGLLSFWPLMRQSQTRLEMAAFMADLVDRYCLEGEKDQPLWELLLGSFSLLEKEDFSEDEAEKPRKEFEKRFLEIQGYGRGQDIRSLGL